MNKSINYRWWHEDLDSIPDEFVEQLEEAAIDHIFERIKEGCTSGVLYSELESTLGEQFSFRGCWNITENDF